MSERSHLQVLVDHRELASGVPELLIAEGLVLNTAQLDLGDYLLGNGVAVERKTVADFAQSIVDRRLFTQVEKLVEDYATVVYLIEGPSLYEGHKLHPNAIRGALSYLTILEAVSIIPSQNAEDSAKLIYTMARHAQQGLGYEISLHRNRRATSHKLQIRYLVEDLPGIGPKMADALLTHFGSIGRLFAAEREELEEVEGIGPKRAGDIEELIERSYA